MFHDSSAKTYRTNEGGPFVISEAGKKHLLPKRQAASKRKGDR